MESTNQIVTIKYPGFDGKVRVWEGITAAGVPFVAYIPLVQVKSADDNTEFERELTEHKFPDARTVRAIDVRMVL